MDLLESIKKLRAEGLTYTYIANKAGIPHQTFFQFTSGNRKLSEENQKILINFLEKGGFCD